MAKRFELVSLMRVTLMHACVCEKVCVSMCACEKEFVCECSCVYVCGCALVSLVQVLLMYVYLCVLGGGRGRVHC